jgi:hypothetical protein
MKHPMVVSISPDEAPTFVGLRGADEHNSPKLRSALLDLRTLLRFSQPAVILRVRTAGSGTACEL